MEFVATSMPGIAELLADELSSLGISVTETGRAHVAFTGGTADALRVCLWSRLAERVLLSLATLGVTPDIAPEKLAASQDWLALVGNDAPLHIHLEHGAGVRGLFRRCHRSSRYPGMPVAVAVSEPGWTPTKRTCGWIWPVIRCTGAVTGWPGGGRPCVKPWLQPCCGPPVGAGAIIRRR